MSLLRSTSKALLSAGMNSDCYSAVKRHTENAVIRYKLSALLAALSSERPGAIKPSAIIPFDLGQIEGIPLCFTDAAALPDGDMVFTPSQRIPTTPIMMGSA
jgi:hypothetical protein